MSRKAVRLNFSIPVEVANQMKSVQDCNWSGTITKCIVDVIRGEIEPVLKTTVGHLTVGEARRRIQKLEEKNRELQDRLDEYEPPDRD